MDLDLDSVLGSSNRLKTVVSGIEVTTELADADAEELEALHQRQLEAALEHAEEARDATRM
jgi:hypothetical protein